MRGEKWKMDSAKWRDVLGVPPKFAPCKGRDAFQPQGLPSPTDRVKVLLDCISIEHLSTLDRSSKREGIEDVMKGAFAEISQSHLRRCYSLPGFPVPTLTTSTVLYSFELDSVVLPSEMFRWHGYPRNLVFPESLHDVKSLLGNSMCAPCLRQALVALCILLYEADKSGNYFSKSDSGSVDDDVPLDRLVKRKR